ncbi:MAG: hypothetical protein ACYS15_07805 [Planctomycetota bacterium]
MGARASAGMIDLGGGWQAEINGSASLFVTYVDLELRILLVEEFANVPGFDPLDITFIQTGDPQSDVETANKIIFNKATISNDTGVDWIGFRDELIGDAATFNEAASGGFAAAPFDMALFDPNGQEVLFSGGTLAAGDVWVAGSGQGALQIDVDLSSTSPVSFVLSQVAIPVPTPGTLALLAIGGLVLVPRRMRL